MAIRWQLVAQIYVAYKTITAAAFQANQWQAAADLDSSNDGGTCPIDTFNEQVAQHVAKIEPGQEAHVLFADLEIKGDEPPGGKICFGYRSQGQWHWDPAPTTITYDTSGGGKRLHMPIDKGPIDALYLATTAGSLAIGKLTYTVDP